MSRQRYESPEFLGGSHGIDCFKSEMKNFRRGQMLPFANGRFEADDDIVTQLTICTMTNELLIAIATGSFNFIHSYDARGNYWGTQRPAPQPVASGIGTIGIPQLGNNWRIYQGVDLTPQVTASEALEKLNANRKRACQHSWKNYQGIMETYDFCEKCDEKRKPNA